jgi:hypothetical protein
MTEASALLTALAFVRHGHAVFPVNWPVTHNGRLRCSCGSDSRGRPCTSPAKHPYGRLAPNGILSATIETGVIKHWFGYLAPEANLGVVTDRLIVLDIDPRHGGDENFRALEREHELPTTWRALTGGGGEHVIFACPDGVEIGNVVASQMEAPPLGTGVDIRARGGYIVAPPSRHISGGVYAWSVDHHPQDTPLAPAPDWLIEKLTERWSPGGSSPSPDLPEPHSTEHWRKVTGGIREYRDAAAASVMGQPVAPIRRSAPRRRPARCLEFGLLRAAAARRRVAPDHQSRRTARTAA